MTREEGSCWQTETLKTRDDFWTTTALSIMWRSTGQQKFIICHLSEQFCRGTVIWWFYNWTWIFGCKTVETSIVLSCENDMKYCWVYSLKIIKFCLEATYLYSLKAIKSSFWLNSFICISLIVISKERKSLRLQKLSFGSFVKWCSVVSEALSDVCFCLFFVFSLRRYHSTLHLWLERT